MPYVDANLFPKVLIVEGTVPANPASGGQAVYIDSADHKFKRVNSSGTVTTIEAAGGSGKTPTLLLDYIANTDLASSLAIASATWVDICTNKNFTVVTTTDIIQINVLVTSLCLASSGTPMVVGRILIDSAGTPYGQIFGSGGLSSGVCPGSPSSGSVFLPASTLSAGVHTIKVQFRMEAAAGTATLLASTTPTEYVLRVQVFEFE